MGHGEGRECGKAVESVTEDHSIKRVAEGSAENWGSSWRSSESVWYPMGMNDLGSREKPVLQIEAREKARG